MKFDDILKSIGEFGPYQIRIYVMVCLIGVPVAMNQMAQVFLAARTEHWCAVEEWESDVDACADLTEDAYLGCIHKYRNASIPIKEDDDGKYYSQCQKFDATYPNWDDEYYAGKETNDTIDCDEGWVYDQSEYTRTIRTDFDLVCDKDTLPDFAQSIFFLGVLIGSIFYGSLSDLIGRFYSFYISVGTLFLFSFVTAFVPNFWSFALLRCLIGTSNMGAFLLAFVIGTELVGPSKRVVAGIVIEIFFSFGYMLLAILAYFVRDWRMLQLIIACPIVLFVFTVPFVPESARWLISRDRYEKAEVIILKAAKGNKKEDNLPPNFIQELKKSDEEEKSKKASEKTPTVIDLFRTPNLRIRTINLMYNWFINSLVYYGLSLSTSDLGSNDFIAFFISGAVELPAYLLCIPAIESPLGRKYATSGFELIGGVACLITIFLPLGAWRTAIAMIGKFGISASFALVYIYSAEIFPTPLRSTGVGICSTASRVAGILAPLILLLDEYWEPLPLLIFGSTCIIGGLLLLFLPETRGRRLPETIQEGEEFTMKERNSYNFEEEEEEKTPQIYTANGEINSGYEDEVKPQL